MKASSVTTSLNETVVHRKRNAKMGHCIFIYIISILILYWHFGTPFLCHFPFSMFYIVYFIKHNRATACEVCAVMSGEQRVNNILESHLATLMSTYVHTDLSLVSWALSNEQYWYRLVGVPDLGWEKSSRFLTRSLRPFLSILNSANTRVDKGLEMCAITSHKSTNIGHTLTSKELIRNSEQAENI